MTIDEAIRRIAEHNYIHQGKEPRAVHITEAFDTLIGVAKKYQKIEQILNRSDDFIFRDAEYRLQEIREVIEDGNVE